ncbi:MAG: phosphoglycerate dehydrogenase [Chloroflexi bacterium]|nr:phosphoglycerate dehydrogenase [Chloroflexota bacterium]
MTNRVVYYGSPDNPRTRMAVDLAPDDIDFGVVDPELPWDERKRLLAETQTLILGGLALTTEEVEALPNLKLLQLMSAGYDRVDVPAVKELGVFVSNSSPQVAPAVSQHAIALMLMVLNRIVPGVEGARDGSWADTARSKPLFELMNRTVGIVGLGNIGTLVARRLIGFDCELVYADPRTIPAVVEQELNVRKLPFEELLAVSDVVTAHVPLYSGTTGLFNAAAFKAMKETAIFINTCRGPVHDEADLIAALESGEIAAAGLDVVEEEPTNLNNPLLHMDNVVLTPHMAGSTEERVERALLSSYDNARRVMRGETPTQQIDPLV